TDTVGCVSRDTVEILNVFSLPIVNLGNDATVCAKTVKTLDAGAGFTYTWSTGAKTQTIQVDTTGTYSVSITDANGCKNSDDITFTYLYPHQEEIGVVTYDSLKPNRVIVAWNRTKGKRTAEYEVYRQGNELNSWISIGKVPYNQTSSIAEEGADLDVKTYSYKLVTRDSVCMNSAESKVHRTIHLQNNFNPQTGHVNLSWNSYKGHSLTSYTIYRYLPSGEVEVLDRIANDAEQLTFTDKSPVAGAKYQIGYTLPEVIRPTQEKADSGPFSQSVSNLSESSLTSADIINLADVRIYPNPAQAVLFVSTPTPVSVTISTVSGVQVLSHQATDITAINIASLPQGIYLLHITNQTGSETVRFVKE
ncbi:MAG: T9SS type A sorting domain-containing protein, partial [Bacteroidales bacterium]